MVIDAMIDRFRATGCAYAIDGKQGGRLLSPLQQVDYRDFAADPWINPQSFTQACAANIGDNDNWNAEITFRYFGVSTVNIYGYSYNGNFYVRTMDLGTANGGVGVWISPRFISSPVYDIVDASGDFIVQSGGLAIKSSVFPAGEFHTINIRRTDSGAEIYFDGVLKSNVTGTINANKSAWSTYTDQGNVQSMLMKNSSGTTVWQAPQSELYSGWLLKPLSQVPGGATFEIKQGLIKLSSTVSTNTQGQFVASAAAGEITTPIDLRGYNGDFSIMWDGNDTLVRVHLFQGNGTTLQSPIVFSGSATQIYISISNGTKSTGVGVNNCPQGAHRIILVCDRTSNTLTLYVDDLSPSNKAIPDDFGALYDVSGYDNLRVRPSTYLSRFAFWPRALSAEEVAAL